MHILRDVMEQAFRNVKVDMTMYKKLQLFINKFIAKNDEHVSFFGGNLIGYYQIRWNYSDTDYWWDEILDVDSEEVREGIFKSPEIVKGRVVSTDPLNHAMFYLIHLIENSSDIPDKDKPQMKTMVFMCLYFKFICSLHVHYYRFPTDKAMAEKTFNSLSKRFDLKVLGTWGKLIASRSKDFTAKGARYDKVFTQYDNDREIVIAINDSQSRLRETYKEITAVYHQVIKNEAKSVLSSSTQVVEGTVILKDLQRQANQYNRYIKNTIQDKDGFIKVELLDIIARAVPSLQMDSFIDILTCFSKEYVNSKYRNHFNKLIDDILTFSFDFLKKNDITTEDLSGSIYRLKHVYMSGRIDDEVLTRARDMFVKVVEVYNPKLKKTPMIPERCGFFLYIILRTITMKYYK